MTSSGVPRRDDSPALARNWLTVLLVDGLVGLGAFGIGVWVMATGSLPIGAAVTALGVSYIGVVVRRGLRWRRLRREAGFG